MLPPSQNGFQVRAGYRTNNPFILRTMIDKARADGETLYVVFVDISNAFSAMNHASLWTKMEELGLTGPYFDFIRMLYREMKVRVASGQLVGEEWEALCGVLMGDPISPTLWNIFVATFVLEVDPDDIELMGSVISHLEHADDLLLVSRTWQGLQRHLNQLEVWCRKNFLTVNGSKSKAMIFGPLLGPSAHDIPLACLTLGGESIPWVTEYRYVGVWFCSVTRDVFRVHYERKRAAAAYVFWKTVLGCDHFVGRGRLPPDVGCQLYFALIDCHLTHACEVALDVDTGSFALVDGLNNVILRRILGIGKRSGMAQIYSELGVYPFRARRASLALGYLRYLVGLPASHYARIAALEADRLRRNGSSSWMGDLALVLKAMPFFMPSLPSFSDLSPALCDNLIRSLRLATRHYIWVTVNGMVSLPLLHGRCEPTEKGTSAVNELCRRHYLTRVVITDHRLALTRLLCGSFFFRGLRTDLSSFSFGDLCCRGCKMDLETPGHVFMLCRVQETVVARRELDQILTVEYGRALPTVSNRIAAEALMCSLIFDWSTVVPMARFIYKVVRHWRGFGRRLPTMACELAPDSDGDDGGMWDFETATEEGSEGGEVEMEIDF